MAVVNSIEAKARRPKNRRDAWYLLYRTKWLVQRHGENLCELQDPDGDLLSSLEHSLMEGTRTSNEQLCTSLVTIRGVHHNLVLCAAVVNTVLSGNAIVNLCSASFRKVHVQSPQRSYG